MNKLKQETVNFLLENNFQLKKYEDQGLAFYKKEIKDSKSIEKLIEFNYSIEPDEEITAEVNGFTMEIQINGETAQWAFLGGEEMYEVLLNEEEFVSYVKEVNRVLA